MKRILTAFAIVGVFVYAQVASASMSSTNYQIRWDTVSTGGSDTSGSTSYLLRDTVSGTADGTASSASYQLEDGYRAGVLDQIISFDLYSQDSSSEKSAASLVSNTLAVSSTTGLSVGQYAAIVQDRGASQVVGIGKIESLTATTVVFDRITSGSSAPSIDGGNDYLYPLTSSSLSLESVDAQRVATGVIAFEVTVDNDDGYVIQILEDGNLREGSNEIDDVSDGEVTAGSEEFGARSSDSSLSGSTFDTQDTSITSTGQDVVTRSTFAFYDRSFVIFKMAAATNTPSATYTNTITFIASGNF